MDDYDYFVLKAGFAIVLALIAIFAMVNIFESNRNEDIWNNGYHALDGGKWEYQQMVGHGYNTYYAYKCIECNKIVELSEYHQEEEK